MEMEGITVILYVQNTMKKKCDFQRLFKFDPIKKINTMLVDKIHFANGLALSEEEDFVVVAESLRCRLIRCAIYWHRKLFKSYLFNIYYDFDMCVYI